MPSSTLPPPMRAPEADLGALLAAAAPRPIQADETAALERLIEIAKGDTGQGRRVADFLLAWWNSGTCGAFDLTNLWGVDIEISADMVTVFALVARVHSYPDSLGYERDFAAIVRCWRPELAD